MKSKSDKGSAGTVVFSPSSPSVVPLTSVKISDPGSSVVFSSPDPWFDDGVVVGVVLILLPVIFKSSSCLDGSFFMTVGAKDGFTPRSSAKSDSEISELKYQKKEK